MIKSVAVVSYLFFFFCYPLLAVSGMDSKRLEMTTSACPWRLTIAGNSFESKQKQLKPDGASAYFLFEDEKNYMSMSVFIEPATQCQDSKSCRDLIWKQGNPGWVNPQNVKLSEIGGISCLEFLIPSFRGQEIRQQNLYAEYVVDGYWVDLHISKIGYQTKEHVAFEKLLESVKFETKESK